MNFGLRNGENGQPGHWPLWLIMLGFAVWAGVPASHGARSTETAAPRISPAMPRYVLDSGIPGPAVVVVGEMHGDAAAGAWAASQIRHWPITRGRLVLLPQNTSQGSFETIWRAVADQQPDWVVDLCEGASTVSAGQTPPARSAAQVLLSAVNATVADQGKRFVLGGPPAPGSLVQTAAERLKTHVLALDTTSNNQPLALRIRQHRIMVHALLKRLGMIDARASVDRIADRNTDPGPIRVAVYAGPGTRKGMRHLLAELQQLPHSTIVPVGPEEIKAGALKDFNVVLFPGGSSTRQGESLGDVDRRQVREFIEGGGGYVGICAGAYLATANWPRSLGILDANNRSSRWKQGRGVVRMEFTSEGREILGTSQDWCDVRYHNGPLLVPALLDDLPDFHSLAVFRSEVAEGGASKGVMVGSPAIVAGQFGKGRVLCFSPHPDQTKGLEELVRNGVRWAAKG
jgi:hypothetical protein